MAPTQSIIEQSEQNPAVELQSKENQMKEMKLQEENAVTLVRKKTTEVYVRYNGSRGKRIQEIMESMGTLWG